MAEQKYNLIATNVDPKINYSEYVERIAKLLNEDEKILHVLLGKVAKTQQESYEILKSNSSMEMGQKYQEALRSIGITCKLEQALEIDITKKEEEPIKTFTCPACQNIQKIKEGEIEVCEKCGIVKDKYLNNQKEKARIKKIKKAEHKRIGEKTIQKRRKEELKKKQAEDNKIRSEVQKNYKASSYKPLFVGLSGVLICSILVVVYFWNTRSTPPQLSVNDVVESSALGDDKTVFSIEKSQAVIVGHKPSDSADVKDASNSTVKLINQILSDNPTPTGTGSKSFEQILQHYDKVAKGETTFTKNDYLYIIKNINTNTNSNTNDKVRTQLLRQVTRQALIQNEIIEGAAVSSIDLKSEDGSDVPTGLEKQFPDFKPSASLSQASTVEFMLQELITGKPPSQSDQKIYLKILKVYDDIAAGIIPFNKKTYMDLVKDVETVENPRIRLVLMQQVAIQAVNEKVVDFIGLGIAAEHQGKGIPAQLQTKLQAIIDEKNYSVVEQEIDKISDPYVKLSFQTKILEQQVAHDVDKAKASLQKIEKMVEANPLPKENNALMRGMLSNAYTLLKENKHAETALVETLKTVKGLKEDNLKVKILNNLAMDQLKYHDTTSAYYFLEYGRYLLRKEGAEFRNPDLAYGILASGYTQMPDFETARSLAGKINNPLRREKVLLSVKLAHDQVYQSDDNSSQLPVPVNPFDPAQ